MENVSVRNAKHSAVTQHTTTGSWYGWMVNLLKRYGLCSDEMEAANSAAIYDRTEIYGGNDGQLPSRKKPSPANKEIAEWAAGDLEPFVVAKHQLSKNLDKYALKVLGDEVLHDFNMTYPRSTEVVSSKKYVCDPMKEKPKVITKPILKTLINNSDSDPEVSYDELNDKIDKCQNTLDMISSEKELLAQTNRNLAGEINNLKSKIAAAKYNERKYYVNKNDLKALETNIKKLKNRTAKDLEDIKSVLQAIEKSYATVGLNNEDNRKITSKYDKLKMRLKMIEKDLAEKSKQTFQEIMVKPVSCLRGEVNEPIKTLLYGDKFPQTSKTPPPPPIPPLGPPAPPLGSLGTTVQYPRYTINTDILKEMSKQLRKPDSKNIRKIPIRSDMKISHKIEKTSDQVQPAALDSLLSVEAPPVTPTSDQLPSAESPLVISEPSENSFPSTSPILPGVL